MNANITEHGLTGLKRSTAQKDIRAIASELAIMGRKSAWGMADLAVWWSDNSTDDMSVLAAWLGVRVETLYDWSAVARKFPLADRDKESDYLTYSHYRALCALESRDDRIKWRDRAAIERIPVNKLRSLLKGKGGMVRGATRPKNRANSPAQTPNGQKGTNTRESANGASEVKFTPKEETVGVPFGGWVQTKHPRIVLPEELSERLYQTYGTEAAAIQAIERALAARRQPANNRGAYLEVRT